MNHRMRAVLIGSAVVFLSAAVTARAGTDARVTQAEPTWADVRVQHETSLAWKPETPQHPSGILCATWMDTPQDDLPLVEFASSTQLGAPGTWIDHGPLKATEDEERPFMDDPDVDYCQKEQLFYFVGRLRDSGHSSGHRLGISSSSACTVFSPAAEILQVIEADKPLMTIDNWAQSPHYGRKHVVYKENDELSYTSTDQPLDGNPWSPIINLYPSTHQRMNGIQGPWPTVAPNGDLYVAWVRKRTSGPPPLMDIEVSRKPAGDSTTFAMVTSPLTGAPFPDEGPGINCSVATTATEGRLKGKIEVAPSPQIEADHLGNLHIVYMHGDPANPTDRSNVYYRRSTNGGTSWETPIKLNDDTGTADQFLPTLVVSRTGNVAVYWYDRRQATDPVNPQFRVYYRLSTGDGAPSTWTGNTPVGDLISPTQPRVDGFGNTCMVGHYNEGDASGDKLFMIWSDNRQLTPEPPSPAIYNPDVWFDVVTPPPPPPPCTVCQSVDDCTCCPPEAIPYCHPTHHCICTF